jgi:glutathione synthase/RimK-type ligase-like ATP-grasp enzyme
MTRYRVALATAPIFPNLSPDDQLVIPALGALGVDAHAAVWSDASVEWGAFDAVVVRSCWDYHLRIAQFLEWVRAIEQRGIPMWNTPSIIRWNADKHYLRALADAGIPVVPTRWIDAGSSTTLAEIRAEERWGDIVVKPAVSASAHDTWRASLDELEENERRFRAAVARGRVLVQPFLEEIATNGEWSVLFIDGVYSHGVLKRPRAGDFRVQAEHGGSSHAEEPPGAIRDVAARALAAAPGPSLYARVDGCEIDGEFHLMELELLEPSLFLGMSERAPERLARAILKRLTAARSA